jgi:hypothetical protein
MRAYGPNVHLGRLDGDPDASVGSGIHDGGQVGWQG